MQSASEVRALPSHAVAPQRSRPPSPSPPPPQPPQQPPSPGVCDQKSSRSHRFPDQSLRHAQPCPACRVLSPCHLAPPKRPCPAGGARGRLLPAALTPHECAGRESALHVHRGPFFPCLLPPFAENCHRVRALRLREEPAAADRPRLLGTLADNTTAAAPTPPAAAPVRVMSSAGRRQRRTASPEAACLHSFLARNTLE